MVLKDYENMCARILGDGFVKVVVTHHGMIEIHVTAAPHAYQENQIRDRTPVIAAVGFVITHAA